MVEISAKEAIKYLKADIENNIAYLNFMENNPITAVYRCGESLLFRGTSDRDWVYAKSNDPAELAELARVLEDRDRNFGLIQAWMLPLLAKGRSPVWKMTSLQLQLPLCKKLPDIGSTPTKLRPEHAEGIYSLWPYANVTTLVYTRERITRGLSAAIFRNEDPVAWAITHDDGAIGFLYVLEEYRGHGYAQDVTIDIAMQLRKLGKPAFVHIEPDNEKSLALARKLGFIQKGEVMWVGF